MISKLTQTLDLPFSIKTQTRLWWETWSLQSFIFWRPHVGVASNCLTPQSRANMRGHLPPGSSLLSLPPLFTSRDQLWSVYSKYTHTPTAVAMSVPLPIKFEASEMYVYSFRQFHLPVGVCVHVDKVSLCVCVCVCRTTRGQRPSVYSPYILTLFFLSPPNLFQSLSLSRASGHDLENPRRCRFNSRPAHIWRCGQFMRGGGGEKNLQIHLPQSERCHQAAIE